MELREKVINGLECCMVGDGHSPKCELCPYATVGDDTCQTMDDLFADAIALLKAQEPRVLTAADFDNNPNTDSRGFLSAWIEFRRDGEWSEYWAGYDDEWAFVRVNNFEGCGYRCWTSRPDEKRRIETPWDTETIKS